MIRDGCIAEQGSHDELMRAKGRYADLWAKQVFLKPKAPKESDDQAVAEGSKTLSVVNDLTVEANESELAKVQEPATPAKPGEVQTPTRAGNDNGTTSHVREV